MRSTSTSSLLAIAVLSQLFQSTNARWEDRPILGLLCMPFLEPWFCLRDRVGHFFEEVCGDEDMEDPQLEYLLNFFYDTDNSDAKGNYLFYKQGWLQDCDYCSWGGITCRGDTLIGLDACKLVNLGRLALIDSSNHHS